MGLIRALLITCLVYLAVEKIWKNQKNPLPENTKKEYEKYMAYISIFFIESLW
jgi:hypothetical protein